MVPLKTIQLVGKMPAILQSLKIGRASGLPHYLIGVCYMIYSKYNSPNSFLHIVFMLLPALIALLLKRFSLPFDQQLCLIYIKKNNLVQHYWYCAKIKYANTIFSITNKYPLGISVLKRRHLFESNIQYRKNQKIHIILGDFNLKKWKN